MISVNKTIAVAAGLLLLFSCNRDENIMHLTGQVKGLKKGKIFLQKIQDSTLVTLDSLIIDGNSNFDFTTEIDEPEVFYLSVNRHNSMNKDTSLLFFGEKGEINIQTSWDYFSAEARVEGSETHEKLEEYEKMMRRFRQKNLELVAAQLRAGNDSLRRDSLAGVASKNTTRSYLYTLNFALGNRDSYIAPYIALADAPNARLKYLDTINNSLSPEVAASKYGRALNKYIEEIKKLEKKDTVASE
ncbi:DUF4369 domain-containing protein [Sinomicrobium pectinilyticum]|uniref:DUF4369 domain-containing protein n=1 Tax=Sinomicrobium pectinilyticum TaxID=1084421 RepID=A0A3N0ET90_SINP1|nr:DUF4369 domain-containing protein [Sinomicrobium pectinilyticum]RNL91021.1 DUF4369 domain-containing protein [Sinomicrobium pectinilyticum]